MSGEVKFFEWNQPRAAVATEISGGGMFLKTPQALPEGSMLTVRVALPGMQRAFTVLTRVVRTVKGGLLAAPGMGVRFLDLQPKDRETIRAYVAARALPEPA